MADDQLDPAATSERDLEKDDFRCCLRLQANSGDYMNIKAILFALSALIPAAALTLAQQPPVSGVEGRGASGESGGAGRGGRGGGPGFVSTPTFDKEPPVLPADLKSGGVLIFSKTNGFRDDAAIQASNAALAAIAHERAWPFFITENGAVMNKEQLGVV